MMLQTKYLKLLQVHEPDIDLKIKKDDQYYILQLVGRKWYPSKRILKKRSSAMEQEIVDYIHNYAYDNGIQLQTAVY